jgi:hypothetical protein
MYTIEAEIEVPAPGKDEYYRPLLEIMYSYTPQTRYEPAELWLIDAALLNVEPDCEPSSAQIMKWAEDWLLGQGYYQACERAEENYEPVGIQ